MTTTATAKRVKNPETTEITSRYYLTNAKLLPAVIRAKAEGRFTDELARMLQMLATRYSMKSWFVGYSYREDMVADAMANLCQNALKFDTERFNNPFAFYTSCIHRSFLQYLNTEKRHRRIRDQMLIEMGENPSFNFTEELRDQQRSAGEFSPELSGMSQEIVDAKLRLEQDDIYEAKKAADKASKEAAMLAVDNADKTLDDLDPDNGAPTELIIESPLLEYDKADKADQV